MFLRRAALALALAGWMAAPALAFSSEADGFAIDFPDTWQTRTGFLGTSVIGLSPLEGKADTFSENVNVVVEEFGGEAVDLQAYTQDALQNMDKFLTAYKLVEQKPVTLGDHPATRLVYDHAQGQYQLRALVYVVVGDDRGYVITCTAQRSSFAKYRPAFEQVVGTFTLPAPDAALPPEED